MTARSPRASAWPAFRSRPRPSPWPPSSQLARETGARVHVCRLSSAAGLEMIRRRARRRHRRHLRRRHQPPAPVRAGHRLSSIRMPASTRRCARQRDRDALRAGLADGAIDCALFRSHAGRRRCQADAVRRSRTRRHRPRTAAAADAEVGARERSCRWPPRWRASPPTRHASSASAAARSPSARRPTSASSIRRRPPASSRETLSSQGKNTPFLGQELKGRVRCTLIEGHLAYDGAFA